MKGYYYIWRFAMKKALLKVCAVLFVCGHVISNYSFVRAATAVSQDYAVQKDRVHADKFRDLIMLLDDGNETPYGMGFAMTITLISALSHAQYPILISSSLWSNFAARRLKFEEYAKEGYTSRDIYDHVTNVNKRINELCNAYARKGSSEPQAKKLTAEKINQEFCSIAAIEKMEKEGKLLDPRDIESNLPNLLCYMTPFDQAAWEIYEVSKDLYLFIPVAYLKNIGITKHQYTKGGITSAERILGLNIDHLKRIHNPSDQSRFSYEKRTEGQFMSCLRNIFVHNNKAVAWNLYLVGHGLNADAMPYGQSCIANLSLNEFRQLLQFLNSSLTTNIFVYTSCFSGGQHLKKVYESKGRSDHYNYPIVTTCLSDIVSMANLVYLNLVSLGGEVTEHDIRKNRTTGLWELKLTDEASDWDTFFEGLHKDIRGQKCNMQELSNVIQSINAKVVNNTPWIRVPQDNQFRILACPSNCAKISAELVAAQKRIGGFIEFNDSSIHYLFIMTSHVSVPLLLSSMYVAPQFVSLIPGDATHVFASCTSINGLTSFVSRFNGLMLLCFDKTYVIKKLKCINDLSYENRKYLGVTIDNAVTLNDVVIYKKGKSYDQLEILFKIPTSDTVYSGRISFSMMGGAPTLEALHPFEAMKGKEYKIYIDKLEKNARAFSAH